VVGDHSPDREITGHLPSRNLPDERSHPLPFSTCQRRMLECRELTAISLGRCCPGLRAGAVAVAAFTLLQSRGMALIGVPKACQLQLAQPLITLVWAVLLMGEQLSVVALATALVVLARIATTQRSRA
jgi:hypothetical protein